MTTVPTIPTETISDMADQDPLMLLGTEAQPKYAVFKWTTYCELLQIANLIGSPMELHGLLREGRIEDAEVIRLKDLTAAPLLYAYSSIIRSFMELMDSMGMLGEQRQQELVDIADHFAFAARAAEALPHRTLPT